MWSAPGGERRVADYTKAKLLVELVRDEGSRSQPYRDSKGKLTIGVGRNLDDVPLSDDEIALLLENDIKRSEADLDRHCPWWRTLTDNRQRALLNMVFNMGWGDGKRGLSTFGNTLRLIEAGNYTQAAANIRRSQYAKDVGPRAERVARLIEGG